MNESYTQDDPRLRPVPLARYPWRALPQSRSQDAVVKVSFIYTSEIIIPTSMITSIDIGETRSSLPCPSVLIERGDYALLFDLGFREDPENFAKPVLEQIMSVAGAIPAPGPIKRLKEYGYDLERLKCVIISHKHLDRELLLLQVWISADNQSLKQISASGDLNTLPYPDRPVILGAGAREDIGKGYPDDPNGHWESAWFKKYRFVDLPKPETEGFWSKDIRDSSEQIDRTWEPVGCFEHGVDWFGDGSFWLIDAPGHCPGHLMALCRVTSQPDTYVLLAGDAAHHQNMYLPVPTSEGDYRTPKSVVDGVVQLADDPVVATYTVGQLTRMSQEENVMVILSHERGVQGIIDYFPKDIGKWKERGWKEAKEKKVTEDAERRSQLN
ncbi:uncharacterized protein IL334_006052 [Kwoniella shivajii]|uniref:Metallo-beta-lactamase domain-containing protein n=1 Tax=Kwoniella shivajii TaxID=564305 RepID=A0ABZ1D4U4_9TREE|nr:hypothetical protein IL334_006052 [Kwoniella shivajii]